MDNTPPPPFTGDEREWFAALIQQQEVRISARTAHEIGKVRRDIDVLSSRVVRLEDCSGGTCGIDELRGEVREMREEIRENSRRSVESIEKLAETLHRTREQVAMEVGRRKGERSKWVRPAAVGTGWATLGAGVLALLLRLLGGQIAEPATLPQAQDSGQR
jgi:hypothetical protein